MTPVTKTSHYRKINKLSLAMVLVVGVLLGILSSQAIEMLLITTIGLILITVFLKQPSWLIYALVVFIPIQFEIEVSQLKGARLTTETLGAGLIVVLILLRWLSSKGKHRGVLSAPNLLLWLIYLLISSVAIAKSPTFSGFAQTAWSVYRTVWVAPLIFLGIWIFIKNNEALRKVITWLTISASFGASVAIIQFITSGKLLSGLVTNFRYLGFLTRLPPEIINSSSGLFYLGGTRLFRGHGTFYAANIFGVLLCVTIVLGWGLISNTKTKKYWLWIGALLLQLGGLVVTFSRSAWAASVAGISFFVFVSLYTQRRITFKKTRLLIIILTVSCVFIIASVFASETIVTHFFSTFSPGQVSEFQWRIYVWNYSSKKILENLWLGLGTSMIENAEAQIQGSGRLVQYSSHNLWLDIAYARGLIVLSIYIYFSIWALLSAWKILKDYKLKNQPEYNLLLGLEAGLIVFFISGVGSASMLSENLSTLFWFMLGSIAVLTKNINARERSCTEVTTAESN